MGGEDSKPTQDDFFLLEHLSKMSLKNRKIISYYLISSQNGPALPPLRQYFKIDTFPSVSTLKQQMSFVNKLEIVKVIVTDSVPQADIAYLQQQSKISQIIAYNVQLNGNKVTGHANNTQQLIQTLNNLEEKQSLDMPPSNVLFTIDQDTKTLNRYRLNYHCNTLYGDRKSAKDDFIKLAKKLYPDQMATINQFEQQYDINLKGQERHKMVLKWVFRNCFYWDMVNQISRNTNDPKRLAYLRLGIKDIYETIAAEYRANKLYDMFYIVIELTEQEKAKLQKSVNNFLLFTSFVKGTFIEKEGLKQFKTKPNNMLFTVVPHRSQRQDTLDFGFVRHGDEVLVNIYNVFRVDIEANLKTRRIELVYGVLPVMDQRRMNKEDRGAMTKIQLDLTRNYDFIEDLMGKIDGQATLLQISGYYKDSLDIYDKKVDFIRKTNESEEVMNRCLIKKGDALVLSGDYNTAQKTYRSVETSSKVIKVIALIHLADMYMRIGDENKLENITNQIQPLLPSLQNQPKQKQEFFKGNHLLAIKSLKKGSPKKAEEKLQKLLFAIGKAYEHNLEGKPIYHDVYRTLAACQFKLGRAPDALHSLNTTRELQLACEGKTHNVAMTETLIQSVSRTCGNKQQLSKSEARMQDLSREIDSNQTRLSPSSVTNINSSMIAISM